MIDRIADYRVQWKAMLAFTCLGLFHASVLNADEVHATAEQASSEVVSTEAAAGSHAVAADHAAHGDEHHETGVPISFKGDLALWSLVTFLLFLFVLKKFAWGPMVHGLDLREAGIRKAIADAEENRRKSQAMLAEYDQRLKAAEQTVQAMVAEARRDAERTSQDLIAAAQREVGAMRERARDDINQARDTALAELFATVNSQVLSAAEHVLGRAVSAEDQDRLVSEALSGISR